MRNPSLAQCYPDPQKIIEVLAAQIGTWCLQKDPPIGAELRLLDQGEDEYLTTESESTNFFESARTFESLLYQHNSQGRGISFNDFYENLLTSTKNYCRCLAVLSSPERNGTMTRQLEQLRMEIGEDALANSTAIIALYGEMHIPVLRARCLENGVASASLSLGDEYWRPNDSASTIPRYDLGLQLASIAADPMLTATSASIAEITDDQATKVVFANLLTRGICFQSAIKNNRSTNETTVASLVALMTQTIETETIDNLLKGAITRYLDASTPSRPRSLMLALCDTLAIYRNIDQEFSADNLIELMRKDYNEGTGAVRTILQEIAKLLNNHRIDTSLG